VEDPWVDRVVRRPSQLIPPPRDRGDKYYGKINYLTQGSSPQLCAFRHFENEVRTRGHEGFNYGARTSLVLYGGIVLPSYEYETRKIQWLLRHLMS
jgi:hypothetical protein